MQTEAAKQALTEGPIRRSLILFCLPIFLSNLFQQLYNSADSIIVGGFLGKQALAAVSSSGNLIFMLVGFFNGTAVGAGVVIAAISGRKNTRRCGAPFIPISLSRSRRARFSPRRAF